MHGTVHHQEARDEKNSRLLQSSQPKPPSHLTTSLLYVPLAGSALYYCWSRLVGSGALEHLIAASAPASYHTGSRLLDRCLYASVKFYRAAMPPENPPFLFGDVSSIAACALIPLVESLRTNAPESMRYPMITGLAAQTLGRGAIYPLYWSKFISSGAARKQPSESVGSSIHQYEAEGAFLASLAGFVLPGLGMSILKSDHWTLAWFLYPITMSLVQKSYTFLRTWLTPYHANYEQSQKRAYCFLQASYFLQFLYATGLHIKVLLPRLFRPGQLRALMHLTWGIQSLKDVSLNKIAYQVIQFDALFLFASSIFATMSFARSGSERFMIALFDFVATAACGTGGALAGIWAWRERRLREERIIYQEVMRGI